MTASGPLVWRKASKSLGTGACVVTTSPAVVLAATADLLAAHPAWQCIDRGMASAQASAWTDVLGLALSSGSLEIEAAA